MENGVEALKIASAVLIFVLAVTITISAFTSASQALNRIFNTYNADEYVTDAEGNFMNFVRFEGGTREVGIETIIPSIYRAYKENYAIYFYNSANEPLELYTTTQLRYDETSKATITEEIIVNYIDLEKEKHASVEAAIKNIKNLLDEKGLYQTLQSGTGTFIEKLGEYYMDDVSGETGTAEVNKIKKRVIVYTQK